jgi:uncharacterized membrane protein YeaQ/YmgE (transglycosylase-associated protein family)
MLELFGWSLGIGAWAALVLVLGALAFSMLAQYIGDVASGFEWSFTAVAVLVGGWLGSEALGALSTWGPEWDGMFVLPAIIGGVVLGTMVEMITRWTTGGTFVHRHGPI